MEIQFGDQRGNRIEVEVALGGHFNYWNVTSATAAMMGLGFSLKELEPHFQLLRSVPGRFQTLPNATGVGVLVDYAHTPDALEKLLQSARELTEGRLITVFGCGGDRQTTKRAPMGRIASELSDVTYITSDNPRTEDPVFIANEVKSGVLGGRDVRVIVDRRVAIAEAIAGANPGDVVVLAGKGHEEYQIIGREKFELSDSKIAYEALAARKA